MEKKRKEEQPKREDQLWEEYWELKRKYQEERARYEAKLALTK